MKFTIPVLIVVYLFLGCGQKLGEYYFDFDSVDCYHNEIDDLQLLELDQSKLTPKQQMLNDLVLEDTPKSIVDTAFITQLEPIGFKKNRISEVEKINTLKEIYREKSHKESFATTCITVYRDILIFRSNDSIVGISKICFDCQNHKTIGTQVNMDNFGQSGDYGKLARLLRN